MRLSVEHTTRYFFEPPMRALTQSLRVWPSIFDGQTSHKWEVEITGNSSVARGASFRDGAGDLIETVSILGGVSELKIVISGRIDTVDLTGVLKGHREKVPPEAYLRASRMTRLDTALQELSEDTLSGVEDPLDRAHALSRAVNEAIRYQSGTTESTTTAAEALAQGRGVCQDQTHALIAVAQAAEIPARYVTGYLHASADGEAHQASHAWAELHVRGLGWVGFDAANACCPDDKYIRLASGHDSVNAAPVRGVAAGTGVEYLEVDVAIREATAQQ